ncbi:indolepyruvate ferredoxin oxidoreductase family protein [Salinispora tropica]|uniref:Pyruvate ferredoxin/flavodoxin oxidoreductase n=1 Tax=Salinispora tropica (strain ATCC BAA-916 / DSM 44818 / JCM 13857 / NBRC 105044 / CNB-440) TaxID=369723 RepID=A4X3Q5_SALTO|nr:indolepyruvate ferredoxin oxidoreductase family protein [Salinispora tropica]ABP53505.1 pyruvate ferredoxin/flavodoxin oxidoreductase [Salinispora tropica CNB-440]
MSPGLQPSEFTLDQRYLCQDGTAYLTGVQALVRLLLDRVRHDRRAGNDAAVFVSGYEGSPLAGYDLELARRGRLLAEHGVVHRPALNEELAATAVLGSQLAAGVGRQRPDGVVGVWYGKAPGLDRAGDALRHANFAGTDPRGGAIALVGDDPAAKSSTVPSASEFALADLSMPVLVPADAADLLRYGLHAIEMSRASGLWSALKIVTNVADAASTVPVTPSWRFPTVAGGYRHRPTSRLLGAELAALEESLHRVRLPLAVEYLRAAGLNELYGHADDRIGIVAAGKSYLDVRQALRTLGMDEEALRRYRVRLLKLAAVYPLESAVVREFAAGLDEIVVVEEKRGFIESAVKDLLYGSGDAPVVCGKTDPAGRSLFRPTGELNPDVIAAGLARRLSATGRCEPVEAWQGRRRRDRIDLPVVARTPYFCSGCPHNSSTKAPPGTLTAGGTGCSTMTFFMDPKRVGDIIGVTQMGGEGAQWIGMAPFVDIDHFVQNVGDGTFHHSASLALRAAVAAGVNITYKVLYNSAVAMTGGQDAVGALPVHRLAALLLAEGATKVIVTSEDPKRLGRHPMPAGVEVRHRDDLPRSQAELAVTPGVTVLIHDQECAAVQRRKRRRGLRPQPAYKVLINERLCEGCGDCGAQSNCLSVQPVESDFGRKTRIHQSSCNADYACLQGRCPSFLTIVPGRSPHRELASVPTAKPSMPRQRVVGDFSVRITGIGGSGVVTLAQIIATAAVLDGRHVRTLDQTGLAQKGGAVVSDVRVTERAVESAARLADGECDLYLATDLLVAAQPANLAAADTARTVVVASTSPVPTGQMVTEVSGPRPDVDELCSALDRSSARATFFDARSLALRLLGDDQFANILQLGAAYQEGAIPLEAASIEQAIRLNGVGVERNLSAFCLGRLVVDDPQTVSPAAPVAQEQRPLQGDAASLRATIDAGEDTPLARRLDALVADLVAYQDLAYAREFVEFVEHVRRVEGRAGPLTAAVAGNLYKLMAYKDEYEVARLSLDERLTHDIAAQFGAGARYHYLLQPPVLRKLVRRKIRLGQWFRVVLRLLYALRRLRGSRLDVFGYTRVRRIERRLVANYRRTILAALSAANPDDPALVELASLPDMVRGFDEVKLANVTEYHRRQEQLLQSLPHPVQQVG